MGGTDPQVVFDRCEGSLLFQYSHCAIVVASEWRYSKHTALAGSDWTLVLRAQSRRSQADGPPFAGGPIGVSPP